MKRKRVPRRALVSEFERVIYNGEPRTRYFEQVLNDIKKRGKELVRSEKEKLIEERRNMSIN
jgi:hypothetical protein